MDLLKPFTRLLNLLLILTLPFLFSAQCTAATASTTNQAILLSINGKIGPATDDYLHQGFRMAKEQNASLIILQLNSNGGLGKSTAQIVKRILHSDIPVITYIAPSGANISGAGIFIVFASHVAAMAPNTVIGSLSATHSFFKNKYREEGVVRLEKLAQLHHRDMAFAKLALTNTVALTSDEALKRGVIDIKANSLSDLLVQLNGMQISVGHQVQTLNTSNMHVIAFNPSSRAILLAIITEPNITYVLLILGILGLFSEMFHPGYLLPGIFGLAVLTLGIIGLIQLPFSVFGLLVLLLGIILMGIEVYVPLYGILGVVGLCAFALGSIKLLPNLPLGYQLDGSLILAMTLICGFFFLLLRLRRRINKIVALSSAKEELLGGQAIAVEDFIDKYGHVRVHGEIWFAHAHSDIKKDTLLRVISFKEHTLVEVEVMT